MSSLKVTLFAPLAGSNWRSSYQFDEMVPSALKVKFAVSVAVGVAAGIKQASAPSTFTVPSTKTWTSQSLDAPWQNIGSPYVGYPKSHKLGWYKSGCRWMNQFIIKCAGGNLPSGIGRLATNSMASVSACNDAVLLSAPCLPNRAINCYYHQPSNLSRPHRCSQWSPHQHSCWKYQSGYREVFFFFLLSSSTKKPLPLNAISSERPVPVTVPLFSKFLNFITSTPPAC